MSSDRHWIMNPVGHRLWEARSTYGRDGETVDSVFGPATLIAPSTGLDPSDWVCDLCNEPILVWWGEDPFPVPMYGGYALCAEHYYEAQDWPAEDEWGEEVEGTKLGVWPAEVCGCQPCRSTAARWILQLGKAYL